MSVFSASGFKQWVKHGESPIARLILRVAKTLLGFEMPTPKPFSTILYQLFCLIRDTLSTLLRMFWWTPLFKGRLANYGKNMLLYGGLPYISGPVEIHVKDNARISGQTTFSGRTCSKTTPQLEIGSNTDIGWMTTIAVGSLVKIGDNTRIAGRTLLAGYPGHPLNPEDRAAGLPENDNQVGDIILEDDVWLATGVSVMAGVTIGRGTIVAAGSVVTKSLPPMVLAGGSPAKVIRSLQPEDLTDSESATVERAAGNQVPPHNTKQTSMSDEPGKDIT